MTAVADERVIDLLDGDFYAGDPYPTYEWLRDNSPVYRDEVNELWGISRHADVVHVIQAVYFGHLSGCPMTAHKISMFIDMPRTSVLRRLAVLARNGYVRRQGRYYYVAEARLRNSPADLDAAIKTLVAAGKALQQSASKMDT